MDISCGSQPGCWAMMGMRAKRARMLHVCRRAARFVACDGSKFSCYKEVFNFFASPPACTQIQTAVFDKQRL